LFFRICFRRVAVLAVANAFCLSFAFAASVDSKRAELKETQGRIGALQKDLAKSQASKADAADALRAVESSIASANRKLHDLNDKRAAVQAQLNELNRQSQLLSGQIDQQQQQLSQLLYQQFVYGGSDALHLLLAGSDPNQSARNRYFITLLSRQKADLLGDMRETLKEKKRLADAAHDKSDELAVIEKQQQQERVGLLAQQKQRLVLLAQIGDRIKSQQKQIDTLKGNEKRLGKLIENLARLAARQKSKRSSPQHTAPSTSKRGKIERGPDLANVSGAFAALRGKLNLPVRGSISGRFGSSRGDNATTWKGIFIRASEGADVRAVADGTVVYADWLRGFGNLIIIDHGDDFLSVYGNNQSLLREAGAEVKAGQTIAAVGSSGISGGGDEESGLYFELRHKGQPFDPLRWVGQK
jgi:septal ring factor EnvC (AmiA/AmiB activator)